MRVLILSPHTDDAELGAGGYISRLLREEEHTILWVVFSTCEESLPKGAPKNMLKKEFLNVVKSLGVRNVEIFDYKVRNLPARRQDILEQLVKINKNFKPNLVIGPSTKDWHQDHQVVANEMIRAFKTSASIIGYEAPWNHLEFETKMFVRLEEEDVENKIKMMKHYKSQLQKRRQYFSEEYIRGLANVRGTQCKSKYAESFEVIKWIQ